MIKCKPKRYVGKCGPMPALRCTIRCTAKHGLTRRVYRSIQVYKVYSEDLNSDTKELVEFQFVWNVNRKLERSLEVTK